MDVSLTVYEIINVTVQRDLENWVRGCSRSLKMSPFDSYHTTFYWSAIVNLSCTVFELVTLNNSHSRSLKLYHSKAWVRFPIRLPW